MLNKEQKDKLKLIVESIDDKLTKEGYIFTARHFDVVMDGMEQLLKQCNVSGSLELLIPMQHKEDEVLRSIHTSDLEKTKAENRFKSITHVIQMIRELQANFR